MPDDTLRPAFFHILLALSREPLHGLGIADDVERVTGGAMELGPGTLYRSLKEMTEAGLIRDARAPEDADPRRRYYDLTPRGRERLAEEVARVDRVLQVARERDVLPERA